MWGAVCVSFVPFVVVFHRVHWWHVVPALWGSGPAGGWIWSSGRVFPPFVRSIALSLVRCLQIWLYFAF